MAKERDRVESKKEESKQRLSIGDQLKANDDKMALTGYNYKLILIGFGVVVLGFILMLGGKSSNPAEVFNYEMFSFRRITLAPILVLGGFAFVIYAIMTKRGRKDNEEK